jgi:hypothetical protein
MDFQQGAQSAGSWPPSASDLYGIAPGNYAAQGQYAPAAAGLPATDGTFAYGGDSGGSLFSFDSPGMWCLVIIGITALGVLGASVDVSEGIGSERGGVRAGFGRKRRH